MRVETSQTDNEKKGGVRLGLHVICESEGGVICARTNLWGKNGSNILVMAYLL